MLALLCCDEAVNKKEEDRDTRGVSLSGVCCQWVPQPGSLGDPGGQGDAQEVETV